MTPERAKTMLDHHQITTGNDTLITWQRQEWRWKQQPDGTEILSCIEGSRIEVDGKVIDNKNEKVYPEIVKNANADQDEVYFSIDGYRWR